MQLNFKNIFILSTIALIITVSIYIIYKKNKYSLKNTNNKESEYNLEEVYEAFIEEEEYIEEEQTASENILQDTTIHFSAWIAYWDFSQALESYKSNTSKIESLSPTWYYLKADGTLELKNTARNDTLRDLCKTNNTKLIPTISNSNADDLSEILNNKDLLINHTNLIVREVETYQYDGIDIDYEYINEVDRDKFTNFISLLSSELHKNNKVLTIAILWKTNLDSIIEKFSSPRAAQDWSALGEVVDEFRIMAYDYTSSADMSGAIAPKDWISDILDYGLSKVSDYKIVLGLPLYAYEWTDGNKGAKALVWNDVQNVKSDKEYIIIEDILDEEKLEKKLTFNNSDITKIIWYQDSEVTNKRIDLAQTYGINKFIFWRLGGEDSEIWNLTNN